MIARRVGSSGFVALVARRGLIVLVMLAVQSRDADADPARIWITPMNSPSVGPVATTLEVHENSLLNLNVWIQPATVQDGAYDATTNPYKTLQNISLNLVTTDSDTAFSDATITVFNPNKGDGAKRFAFVNDTTTGLLQTTEANRQTGTAYPLHGIYGLTVFPKPGIGIGPICDAANDVCGPTTLGGPAWLLSSISLRTPNLSNDVSLFLQIGYWGMNHLGESSAQTTVVFGAAGDPAHRAGQYPEHPFGDREANLSGDTPDLILRPTASRLVGDFNGNGAVDAADYVVWRDGLGTLSSTAGYTDWRTNFGQRSGQGNELSRLSVPEPKAGLLLPSVTLVLTAALFPRRGRRPRATATHARALPPVWRAKLLVSVAFIVWSTSAATYAALSISTFPVDLPGNLPDLRYPDAYPNGIGAVPYDFNIATGEITNAQYVAFLNSVAASDPYRLYVPAMSTFTPGGILRTGTDGSYAYSVKPTAAGQGPDGSDYTYADKPAVFISFFDALRFANWMHNGQRGMGTTEDGAYTLLGGTPRPTNWLTVQRNPGARWWLPNEDEWYKAAYYSASARTYFDFPTATNQVPNNNTPGNDTGNSANYFGTANVDYPLTSVGAYRNSYSPSYTSDQGGNAAEWTEGTVDPQFALLRSLRGGSWLDGVDSLRASTVHFEFVDFAADAWYGFRLARAPMFRSLPRPGRLLNVSSPALAGERGDNGGGIVGTGTWPAEGGGLNWTIAYNNQTQQYDYEYHFHPGSASAAGSWILELGGTTTDWMQLFNDPATELTGIVHFEVGQFSPGTTYPGMPAAIAGVRFDFIGDNTVRFSANAPVWGDFYATDGQNAVWNAMFNQGTWGSIEPTQLPYWIPRPRGEGVDDVGFPAADMNDDGLYTQRDVDLFALALRDRDTYYVQLRPNGRCLCMEPEDAGDINHDGRVDFDDVAQFSLYFFSLGFSSADLQPVLTAFNGSVPEPPVGLGLWCPLFIIAFRRNRSS